MVWSCLLVLVGLLASVYSLPGIGDACRITKTGRFGTCKDPRDCPKALEIIMSGGHPEICSYQGEDAIVCCADRDEEPPEVLRNEVRLTKSFQKCQLYGREVTKLIPVNTLMLRPSFVNRTECNMPSGNQLIINGQVSKLYEFPHMAVLGFGARNDISWQCGGSLISDRYVLTAGHCIWTKGRGSVSFALLGDQNISSTDDDGYVQLMEVDQVIHHPKYKPPAKYNDIALLRLKEPVEFTAGVRPACIYDLDSRAIGDMVATVTGWGRTESQGEFGEVLKKADLRFVDIDDCVPHYNDLTGGKQLSRGIDASVMLCAGDPNRRKDTCQGDSGGPLQLVLTEPYCMYGIVGVTSFGPAACNGAPGVYAKVSHFRTWIESIVWPN